MFERIRRLEFPYSNIDNPNEKAPEALYDLITDIGEQHNVIAEHPDVAERLRALAEKMRDDLGDLPLPLFDSSIRREGKNRRPPGKATQ
jgi:hypothetical protein